MTDAQIVAIRAYLRQWIAAPIWDQNPYAGPLAKLWLTRMRTSVDHLIDREAIEDWLEDADALGIEPL